ncbi:MAG: efflux RND transporter permease subunit, partial [Calditrichaeota bacterium]|nr:efflux RND transporter permease subunit [Calditrichota bacterium]
MKFLKWPIENPVFVNMLMVLVVIVGLLTLRMLPREINPEISLNWINITTIYPGASAEDMEKLVTKDIEDEISDVDHIESITSWSGEGFSRLSVKFEDVSDDVFQRDYQDIVSEVGKVKLPDGAEDPVFFKWSSSTFLPVLNVAVFGDAEEKELKEVAKNLKNDLNDLAGVSKINISGERDREVWIELDPNRINEMNLSFDEVQNAILMRNMSITTGAVKYGGKEIVFRVIGEFKDKNEVMQTIVRFENGRSVQIKDIATVSETFKRASTKSRFDGKKSITLSVYKKPGVGTLKVVDAINGIMTSYNQKLPQSIRVDAVTDTSYMIDDSLGILSSNALMGVILVLFLLHMFLGTRNAVFAAIGIPTSFLITFIFLYLTDQTMNVSVMFGMVLVLGMLVDDAMVIIENVYRYIEKGSTVKDAVLKGVPEVAVPVMSSIFTTIAAFLPLMLMPGIMGKFMRVIPFVVCLALVASILEAFFLLPVHIAKFGRKTEKEPIGDKYVLMARTYYDKWLANAIKGRWYLVIGITIAFFIGVGLIAEGAEPVLIVLMLLIFIGMLIIAKLTNSFKKRFVIPIAILIVFGAVLITNQKVAVLMFAEEPLNMIFVRVKAPQGTNLDQMEQILDQYENAVMQLPDYEIKGQVTNVGLLNLDVEVLNGSNVGEIIVDVIPKNRRVIPEGKEARHIDLIIAELRERTKDITGVEWVGINYPDNGPPAGRPVEVKILGKDFEVLEEIATKIKSFLENVPGVYNIDDDFVEGKEEYRFIPDDYALKSAGLNLVSVNNALQKIVAGQALGVMRDADEEMDVILKYPEDIIDSKDKIQSIRVPNQRGELIPLSNLGHFEEKKTLDVIRRFKRNRAVTVGADLNTELITSPKANEMIKDYFKSINDQYSGYRLSFEGEFKEFESAFSSLLTLFFIGIGLMFIILGTQFKSWIRPLMIMLTIPLAFVGAMF